MPSCEYTCLECNHTFEVFTTAEHVEDDIEVECPECGSTQTVRTYHDGVGPGEDHEVGERDEEDDGINPDDE